MGAILALLLFSLGGQNGQLRDPRVSPRGVARSIARIDERLGARHWERLGARLGERPGSLPGRLARSRIAKVSRVGELRLPRIDIRPRARSDRPFRVLVSAGLHGNETTGVLSALRLAERALKDPSLSNMHLTILPLVNPSGLARHKAENALGADVNASFANGKWTPESRAVTESLRGEKFDLFVDLHGSVHDGFFLIRQNDDKGLGRRALHALAQADLLNATGHAVPGRPGVTYHLDAPGSAVSTKRHTFKEWMARQGTPLSYTLEYPRSFELDHQQRGTQKLLLSLLRHARASASAR